MIDYVFFFFFFFQAEDGIRDLTVTGVQTCALPISSLTVIRAVPLSVCVAVISAPGNTAPLWSLTVPLICAVAPCPAAVTQVIPESNDVSTRRVRMRFIELLPKGRKTHLITLIRSKLQQWQEYIRCLYAVNEQRAYYEQFGSVNDVSRACRCL